MFGVCAKKVVKLKDEMVGRCYGTCESKKPVLFSMVGIERR